MSNVCARKKRRNESGVDRGGGGGGKVGEESDGEIQT